MESYQRQLLPVLVGAAADADGSLTADDPVAAAAGLKSGAGPVCGEARPSWPLTSRSVARAVVMASLDAIWSFLGLVAESDVQKLCMYDPI